MNCANGFLFWLRSDNVKNEQAAKKKQAMAYVSGTAHQYINGKNLDAHIYVS